MPSPKQLAKALAYQGEIRNQPQNRFLGGVADVLKPVSEFLDRDKISDRIPFLGGLSAADLTGVKGTESLVRDMSYGTPPIRGATLNTVKVDPRLVDVAGLGGAMIPVAKNLTKAALREGARQIETGTGIVGRNTLDPRTRMFAGEGAKTADKQALKVAKDMQAAGVPDETIHAKTGWTLGFPDKKPRFEIDDSAAKISGYRGEYGGFVTDSGGFPNTTMELMPHNQLQKAYPDVNNIGLSQSLLQGNVDSGSRGGYTAAKGEIPERISIYDFPMQTKETGKSTTLHELQHAIQQREGFARGGSPEQFSLVRPTVDKIDFSAISPIMEKYGIPGDDLNDDAFSMLNSLYTKAREKGAKNTELEEILKQQDKIMDLTDKALSPYEQYRRLSGEAEARLTQSRMNMTAAERAASYPPSMFDVPVKDQIVRYGDGQAMSAVKPVDNVRIFRGSWQNEPKYTVEENFKNDVYGGVFGSSELRAAQSHGGDGLHYTDIPEDKILTHYNLNYEIPYKETKSALLQARPDLKNRAKMFDEVYKTVIEDRGSDLSSLDDNQLIKMFGTNDFGEANNEVQRLRGQVSKNLGYRAVEMADEHGEGTYLVSPGAEFRRHEADIRQAMSVPERNGVGGAMMQGLEGNPKLNVMPNKRFALVEGNSNLRVEHKPDGTFTISHSPAWGETGKPFTLNGDSVDNLISTAESRLQRSENAMTAAAKGKHSKTVGGMLEMKHGDNFEYAKSARSNSQYITHTPTGAKIRISDHKLPDVYESADFEVSNALGKKEQAQSISKFLDDYATDRAKDDASIGVGGAMIQRPKTEFEILHDTAQRNAALPVEQGGLGLPANNTYIDRAGAMGFDTPAYHGTGGDFSEFDPNRTKIVKGSFSTTDPAEASSYADGILAKQQSRNSDIGHSNVMPLLLNASEYRKMSPYGWNLNNIEAARNEGMKGAISQSPTGVLDTHLSFDPSTIRSRFAAFDPMRRHEADILAGVGVGGMLDPQAIAEALRQQDRK